MLALTVLPLPSLSTQRLELRSMKLSDAEDFFQIRSNKEAMKYIDRPLMDTVEQAQKMIMDCEEGMAQNQLLNWGIYLKGEEKLIGTIGFYRLNLEHHRGEIGYMLHPSWWRKGLMQEAIAAILDIGFDHYHFHSLEANLNPSNEASEKLLIKNGFEKEGYFKESYYSNGIFLDSLIYSKLAKNHR